MPIGRSGIDAMRDYLDNAIGGSVMKNAGRSARRQWVCEALSNVNYDNLCRDDRGFVRQYLQRVTGYSRAAIARHIAAHHGQTTRTVRSYADSASPDAAVPISDTDLHCASHTCDAVRRTSFDWRAALLISSAFLVFGQVRGSSKQAASLAPLTSRSFVAEKQPMSANPEPPILQEAAAPSWLGALPSGDFQKRLAERRNTRRRTIESAAPITASTAGFGGNSTIPTRSEYQNQIVASLMNISGTPNEGKVVIFKNGKATWGDPTVNLLHAGSENRTTGIGRKPSNDGSIPSAFSSGTGREGRGGGGGGGGGGSTNVTNITNTTTGLDATEGDARYVNDTGDESMAGALTILSSGVGLNISNTASGSHIHAERLLTSSGALIVEGATVLNSTFKISSILSCANGFITDAAGAVSCGTVTDWHITGNSGTNPSSNFLGSLDDQDVAFRRNNSEVMRIVAFTNASSSVTVTGLGIGTTAPEAHLQVTGGGLCVGSDSNCNTDNDNEGVVYSSSTSMTLYDVAEQYPTKDLTLAAAEIISLDTSRGIFVQRAQIGHGQLLGVVSAKPAMLLGGFNGEQFSEERQVAVALSGRVPVNVTTEGGDVHIGDELTVGSIPGVARKARSGERTVGYALQGFSGSTIGQILVFVRTGRAALDALTMSGGRLSVPAVHAEQLLSSSGFLLVNGGARFGSGVTIASHATTPEQNLFSIRSDVAGSSDAVFRVTAGGDVSADGAFTGGGADYAEWFSTADADLKFGEAVCVDITRPNSVKRCTRSGDPDIIGLVSSRAQAAFIGNKFSGAEDIPIPGTVLVGLIGQLSGDIVVSPMSGSSDSKGSSQFGREGIIRPGDPLAAGVIPGTLRKALPGESTVGVALEGLDSGRAMKKVLISRKNQSLTVEAVEQQTFESIKSMKIEDEVNMMVQGTLDKLNLNESVRQEVLRQLNTENLSNRVAALEERIAAMSGATQKGAYETSVIGDAGQLSENSLSAGDISAQTLSLENTLTVNDASVLGDLTVGGVVSVGELYVPHGVKIDGAIRAASLKIDSDAIVDGALTLNGTLNLTHDVVFSSGSALFAHDIIVRDALHVIGPITVDGLAQFMGDMQIKGQLVLGNRQAGFAEIPQTGTAVTVFFGSGVIARPVVTASPDVPVPYAVSRATQTGFTILLAYPAAGKITFSWVATLTEDPKTVFGRPSAEGGASPILYKNDAEVTDVTDKTVELEEKISSSPASPVLRGANGESSESVGSSPPAMSESLSRAASSNPSASAESYASSESPAQEPIVEESAPEPTINAISAPESTLLTDEKVIVGDGQ